MQLEREPNRGAGGVRLALRLTEAQIELVMSTSSQQPKKWVSQKFPVDAWMFFSLSVVQELSTQFVFGRAKFARTQWQKLVQTL